MALQESIRLYDGAAPGSEECNGVQRRYYSDLWATEVVVNVVVPTLTPVLPVGDDGNHGHRTAVVVAPGGAFHALSIDSEGIAVAERLAALGIVAFVLQYRLVPGGHDPVAELTARVTAGDTSLDDDMRAVVSLAGADGEAAVRLVRARAAEFGVNPGRVGFMGFSAGGSVAMHAAYSNDPQARPDFVAPIYATTRGVEAMEPPAGSGPMFLVVATNDELGLTDASMALYEQWRRRGLSVELHAYAQGGHGFGMRTQHLASDTWFDRFADWYALLPLTARP